MEITDPPEYMNTVLVEQTMDVIGYTRRHYAIVVGLTAANLVFTVGAAILLVPIIGILLAVGIAASGLILLWFMATEMTAFKAESMSLRDALERRLGQPGQASHWPHCCGDCSLGSMGQIQPGPTC